MACQFRVPELPDTGDLRQDLVLCARASVQTGGRTAEVLASVITASRHDAALRATSQQFLGAPYTGLFEGVLSRAVERGVIDDGGLDLETLAQVFPAYAYQKVAARGLLVSEEDVVRVVDGVLMQVLRHARRSASTPGAS